MAANSDNIPAFSIVIPTKNRGVFLERLLSYYQGQNLKEPILIADSSEPGHAAEVKQIIDQARGLLNVTYRSYAPDIGLVEKLSDTLALVDTDLTVVGADDDFFTVRGLRCAAEFLQTHAEFSLAHGRAVMFELSSGLVYGNSMRTAQYVQRSIEQPTAAARLLDHLSMYSTLWYSMHRTVNLQNNVRRVADLSMDLAAFTELLPSCLSVIQGRVKRVEQLYMVRQVYARRESPYPTVFDWVTHVEWGARYARFQACIAEELSDSDKISRDAAVEIVRQAFWSYLAKTLTRKRKQRYDRDAAAQFRSWKNELARRIPLVPAIWQRGRSLLPGEANQMLLPTLLQQSSPFHEDFMPIYRAIERT